MSGSDNEFDRFVSLLHDIQGPVLCQFTAGLQDIVVSVFEGTLDISGPFLIEHVDKTKILELPRFSQSLLMLLEGPRRSDD
jgi:hypothetical protein